MASTFAESSVSPDPKQDTGGLVVVVSAIRTIVFEAEKQLTDI